MLFLNTKYILVLILGMINLTGTVQHPQPINLQPEAVHAFQALPNPAHVHANLAPQPATCCNRWGQCIAVWIVCAPTALCCPQFAAPVIYRFTMRAIHGDNR